jgi:hypothetical protein
VHDERRQASRITTWFLIVNLPHFAVIVQPPVGAQSAIKTSGSILRNAPTSLRASRSRAPPLRCAIDPGEGAGALRLPLLVNMRLRD